MPSLTNPVLKTEDGHILVRFESADVTDFETINAPLRLRERWLITVPEHLPDDFPYDVFGAVGAPALYLEANNQRIPVKVVGGLLDFAE